MFKIKWIYWFPQFVSFCHYTVLKEALSCGHVGDKKSFILAKENDDALPLVKKKKMQKLKMMIMAGLYIELLIC